MAITVVPTDPSAPTNAELFEALTEISVEIDSIRDIAEDLKTEAIGSWIWDKGAAIMTMVDTIGAERFKFSVEDSASEAKRERRTDLE